MLALGLVVMDSSFNVFQGCFCLRGMLLELLYRYKAGLSVRWSLEGFGYRVGEWVGAISRRACTLVGLSVGLLLAKSDLRSCIRPCFSFIHLFIRTSLVMFSLSRFIAVTLVRVAPCHVDSTISLISSRTKRDPVG